MTTARDIIHRAFRELGLIKAGNAMPESDYQECLLSLNSLCDMLSNNQSFSPYANSASKALNGEASFTIGATGDLVTVRPIRIDTCTVDRNGITYPVEVVDNQKWDAIVYKAAAGANTRFVYYEATSPNGIVHVWPLCSGVTLNMRVINPVLNFPSLTTALIMPQGYEEACIKMLAVNISPQYPDGVLSPITVQSAKKAMGYISTTNNVIPTMRVDPAVMGRNGGYLSNFLGG